MPKRRGEGNEPFRHTLEEVSELFIAQDPSLDKKRATHPPKRPKIAPNHQRQTATKRHQDVNTRSDTERYQNVPKCRSRHNTQNNSRARRIRRDRSRSDRRNQTRSSSRATRSSAHNYRPCAAEQRSIEAMCNDITEDIRDRAEFAKFDLHCIDNTARIFARFGLGSFSEMRPTRADQRSHFVADAKKSYGFKSLKLTHELFALSPPSRKGETLRPSSPTRCTGPTA